MEITKPQNKVLELSARIDPRSVGFKFPGIQTWFFLLVFIALVVFIPFTALTVARVLAIYLLLRFMVVAFFYLVSLVNIRRAHQRMRSTGPLDGLTAGQAARYARLHHIIIIPNYKEPFEVLCQTLDALVAQSIPHAQLSVVMAMEESEGTEAHAKGDQLQERYGGHFSHFFVTYHPAHLAGEIPGKATNQNWGARIAKRQLVDVEGLALEDITITSCDADSHLDPDYFRELGHEFVTCARSENIIWQSPIFFDQHIWQVPASVRLLTFFNNAVQISELSAPMSQVFPLSTYSLSFKLVVDVDYWDPIVISDDWHMFLRCFFAKDGDMRVRPIFLPTTGEPFLAENTLKTWMLVYRTRVRHAWGAGDMVYVLQQWGRQPGTPVFKKFGRFMKIWHDNMVFSLGSVFVAIGTLLSINLVSNPVITYIPVPVPYLMEVFNALGVLGMLTIWIVERIRCNSREYSWKIKTLLEEIGSWVIFSVITFVLAGLPVLHAHTKMLLGSDLTFERTPKGVLLQAKNH